MLDVASMSCLEGGVSRPKGAALASFSVVSFSATVDFTSGDGVLDFCIEENHIFRLATSEEIL